MELLLHSQVCLCRVERVKQLKLVLHPTIVSFSATGSLRLISSTANSNFFYFRNRAGYQSGDTSRVIFRVGHVGDERMAFNAPAVTWLKDGVPITSSLLNTDPQSNGGLESTLPFVFSSSDAGVYQCIFTDTARSEVFLPHPIRLDTGQLLAPPTQHLHY